MESWRSLSTTLVKGPGPLVPLTLLPRVSLPTPPFSSQEKNQRPTHLAGAFLAFILGNVYFWLQLLLRRLKNLPQPGAPWIGPLRLGLCSFCTILIVASILLVSGVGVGGGSSPESVFLSGCGSPGTSLPFSGLQHLHRIMALSSRMPTLGSRCPGWNALSSTH